MKARRFPGVTRIVVFLAAALAVSSGRAAGPPVDFTFDQIDIAAFVRVVSEVTQKRFVVSEGIKGRVTIVAPAVDPADVYPLLMAVLESAGCSVVEDGGIYRVVKIPERAVPVAPVVEPGGALPETGMVTEVIRLQYVRASELRKAIEGQADRGKGASVGAVEETNHLIVTDRAAAVRRIREIVREVDQPGMARTTEVVPLEFAGAEALAAELTQAMSDGLTRGDLLRGRLPAVQGARDELREPPMIVASPHANRLILVGTGAQIQDLKQLIAKMDVDAPVGQGRLNAVFLKYIEAEDAAKSLKALLEQPIDKKEDTGPRKRAVAIEPSAANNAILVDASPGDFETVRRLIEQLDMPAEQIHIEVMIAEKSVNEDLAIGVEMAAVDMPGSVGDTTLQGSSRLNEGTDNLLNTIQQGLFPKGLSVGVARGSHVDSNGKVVAGFPAVINVDALSKDSTFHLLSRTSLETQNNKEATVSIVNEIPILKSTIEGGSGTSRDVIQNIERMDVGIKLKLKPHVGPEGDVQMVLNPSIEAVTDPGPSGTQFAPTIAKREVSTTVTVADGNTIVIAGLTREDKTKIVKKVPLLGSLPLLGWLFRSTSDANEKTDLLVFVTPTIVTGPAGAERVMREWKAKTGLPDDEKQDE